MGSCLCKGKRVRGRTSSFTEDEGTTPIRQRATSRGQQTITGTHSAQANESLHGSANYLKQTFVQEDPVITKIMNDVKELIRQTLIMTRQLATNDQEPPTPLLKLNLIAEQESGWLLVIMCFLEAIPVDDPLGPAVITLFLDESPLPTKIKLVKKLLNVHMRLDEACAMPSSWHRNVCIVLGCLAEKLAGPSSVQICTPIALSYLINNLRHSNDMQVTLFSLIALEKFAQTIENRLTICHHLQQIEPNPLIVLESWLGKEKIRNDWVAQQIAFCAQWSLDNIFVDEKRPFSYLTVNVDGVNAMLNHEDVSEYLKIAPNGLEARCDVSSFESVRCTFEATEGVWFYEALILTPGVMQIGFATKHSRFANHEGYGIGDDDSSVAYDGCRQLIWHNAAFAKIEHDPWKPGDCLGCLLNITESYVQFYLNGVPLRKPHRTFMESRFNSSDCGYFAAASFMSYQQCRFNFGGEPFRFPPDELMFKKFNDYGTLTHGQKTILPRRQKLLLLTQTSITDDACSLCYAKSADTVLEPCGHGGICSACAKMLETCALCRVNITERVYVGLPLRHKKSSQNFQGTSTDV